jgi:hypothetical protein
MFEIANVSYSSDDIEIINKTVLNKIVKSFEKNSEGGRFIVVGKEALELSFSANTRDAESVVDDVPLHLHVHGVLKIFAQVLGRNGMSSSWCMWCKKHPSEWRSLYQERNEMNIEVQDLWTIQEQLGYIEKINRKELKNPKKKGIVSTPLIPFIQPQDYIFPLLDFEIGAVNNVLDSLQNFVEDQVEIISDTQKVARNRIITLDVAYSRLNHSVQEAHAMVGIQQLWLQKAGLGQTLRQRGLNEE